MDNLALGQRPQPPLSPQDEPEEECPPRVWLSDHRQLMFIRYGDETLRLPTHAVIAMLDLACQLYPRMKP